MPPDLLLPAEAGGHAERRRQFDAGLAQRSLTCLYRCVWIFAVGVAIVLSFSSRSHTILFSSRLFQIPKPPSATLPCARPGPGCVCVRPGRVYHRTRRPNGSVAVKAPPRFACGTESKDEIDGGDELGIQDRRVGVRTRRGGTDGRRDRQAATRRARHPGRHPRRRAGSVSRHVVERLAGAPANGEATIIGYRARATMPGAALATEPWATPANTTIAVGPCGATRRPRRCRRCSRRGDARPLGPRRPRGVGPSPWKWRRPGAGQPAGTLHPRLASDGDARRLRRRRRRRQGARPRPRTGPDGPRHRGFAGGGAQTEQGHHDQAPARGFRRPRRHRGGDPGRSPAPPPIHARSTPRPDSSTSTRRATAPWTGSPRSSATPSK